jgi:hypothetical protein
MTLPQGSTWKKWDLHIHSPKSFLNNEYGNCNIDDFVKKVVESGVEAIGLTNYFRFDDDELGIIKKKLNDSGVVVFLNLEIRTQPKNKDNDEMHIHLIFSDQTPENKIKGFLGRLKTIDDKYCKDLSQKEIETTSIAFDTLRKTLDEDKEIKHLKDYLLVACPRGYGNFRPSGKDDGRGTNLAVVIDKHTDILFGKEADRDFFLKTDRYNDSIPKPVLFCSDAHGMNNIGKGFTWIKANTTFEGLKQILYEPEDRVRIQELKPEDKSKHVLIDRIEYKDNNGNKKIVYLNQNLNAIIGSRAQGKSNLLRNIAYAIDPKQCELREVNTTSFLHLNSFKVFWRDEKEDILDLGVVKEKGILFIPQKYLGELVYENNPQFDKFLINLFENSENFKKAIESYRKFEDTNILTITSLIRDILSIRAIGLDKQEKIKKLGKEEEQKKDIEDIEKKIQRFGKTASVNKIELKKYSILNTKISQRKKEIKIIEQDLSSFKQLKDEKIITFERILDLEFSKISSDKIKDKLEESDEAFKRDFIDREVKTLTELKTKIIKIIFGLEKDIEPLQRKIQQSKALIELTELLSKKKETKMQIENIMKELRSLRTTYEAKKKEIIDVYSQFESQYKNLNVNFGNLKFSQVKIIVAFDTESFCKTIDDYINYYNSINFKKNDREKHKKSITFLNMPTKYVYNKKEFPSLLKELLDNILSSQLLIKAGKDIEGTLMELLKNRYKIDFLRSVVDKSGIGFPEMSDGEQVLALLEFIFKFDDYNYPILLDQPEDDLDSRAISTTIVDFIKSEKARRQIIIASHNANLVVCGDSENILISKKKGGKNPEFEYFGGAIEDGFINKEIVEILEGGKTALRKRMLKLNITSEK